MKLNRSRTWKISVVTYHDEKYDYHSSKMAAKRKDDRRKDWYLTFSYPNDHVGHQLAPSSP